MCTGLRAIGREPARNVFGCVLLALGMGVLLPSGAFLPAKPIAILISKITRHARALPDDEIRQLAGIAEKPEGTKVVSKILGDQKLPTEILEDTYLRIAVQRERIGRQEAEGLFERLGGVEGFRSTLSKVIGNSAAKTSGHLYEIRIADGAVLHGFSVKGIGVAFNDGLKRAATDIDVVLEKAGKVVAVEAKDYEAKTPIPLITFRADMATLAQYKLSNAPRQVIPVFSMAQEPADTNSLRILKKEAERHGVQLIFGSPEQVVDQITQLHEIL
jgi:hypothetical protein